MTEEPGGVRPARLNPFVFPLDTDLRFLLLAIALIGAALFAYNSLYFAFNSRRYLAAVSQCPTGASRMQALLQQVGGTTSVVDPGQGCMASVNHEIALWELAGVMALLVITGAIYLAKPGWHLRRSRLRPLSAEDAPEIVDALVALCHEAGLARPPVWVWDPMKTAATGQAFGRWPRYYVELSGGLVMQYYADRPVFHAIVRHELAHLRNADVDKSQLVVATWPAFLITVILPLVLLARLPLDLVLSVAWRTLALALLVHLMRAAVLRTREVYADVRASIWDGPGGALSRVVAGLPKPRLGLWRNVWRGHPDPVVRATTIADTRSLFETSWWAAFAVGVTAGIAFTSIHSLLMNLLDGSQVLVWAPNIAALLDGGLAAVVAGAWVWRAVFLRLTEDWRPTSLGRLAIGLTLGLAAGQFVSFTGSIDYEQGGAALGMSVGQFLAFNAVYLILAAAGLWLLLRWIADGAEAWLAAALPRAWSRWPYLASLVVAAGLLALWLGPLQWAAGNGFSADAALAFVAVRLGLSSLLPLSPAVFLALVALWAFPLASWLWQRNGPGATIAPWAFLDVVTPPVRSPAYSPVRLAGVLRSGLVAGLLYTAVLLIIRLYVRGTVPEATRATADFRLSYFALMSWLAVGFQVAVAVLVATRPGPLRFMRAMFAAFVAGIVAAAGLVILNFAFGGTANAEFLWSVLALVTGRGAVLALPIVLLVAGLASLAQRSARVPSLARTPAQGQSLEG